MGIIGYMIVLTARERVTGEDYIKLENAGLFWHLVDIIWIYLFPLFYLII
jgi:cytochrome c oxidase subunit 3